MIRESGASSTPRPMRFVAGVPDDWIVRSSRTMTVEFAQEAHAIINMLLFSAARCARELAGNSIAL
jgi:hypothetical protein